jgi:hypothetical protein
MSVSPFLGAPDAGYGFYLAAHDNGEWFQMTRPGASGYGILLATINEAATCSTHLSEWNCEQKEYDLPLLIPQMVRWHSIVDEGDRLVIPDVINSIHSQCEVNSPLVAITIGWLHDPRGVHGEQLHYVCPVITSGSADEYEPTHIPGIGDVAAFAAPWQILPISDKETALILQDAFQTFMGDHDAWLISECPWCALEYAEYNESEEMLFEWHEDHHALREFMWLANHTPYEEMPEPPRCHFEFGMVDCFCGLPPTYMQRREAVLQYSPLVCGHCWFPENYQSIWEYALDRYTAGWDAVYSLAQEGDPWSTSLWRRWSPFSGSASHAVPLLKSCQVSTSSLRQLELFQEPSPSSMPSAS